MNERLTRQEILRRKRIRLSFDYLRSIALSLLNKYEHAERRIIGTAVNFEYEEEDTERLENTLRHYKREIEAVSGDILHDIDYCSYGERKEKGKC